MVRLIIAGTPLNLAGLYLEANLTKVSGGSPNYATTFAVETRKLLTTGSNCSAKPKREHQINTITARIASKLAVRFPSSTLVHFALDPSNPSSTISSTKLAPLRIPPF